MFEWYFRVYWFEKNGFIYYILGATIFAKYWPNRGSYWYKIWGGKAFRGFHSVALNELNMTTRVLEIIHLVFMMLLLPFLWISPILFIVLNFFVNILPIMSQRYIRARINFIESRKRAYRFW